MCVCLVLLKSKRNRRLLSSKARLGLRHQSILQFVSPFFSNSLIDCCLIYFFCVFCVLRWHFIPYIFLKLFLRLGAVVYTFFLLLFSLQQFVSLSSPTVKTRCVARERTNKQNLKSVVFSFVATFKSSRSFGCGGFFMCVCVCVGLVRK